MTERQPHTAAILLIMILAAEILDVSFPSSVITFHVSVSAAFCFAAGLTAGPVLGCLVVALAHTIGSKVEAAYRRGKLLEKRRELMDAWAAFALGGCS